ncbi:hypothetical protein [Haloplasma contractile]|uniref:Uncharacterized protein n=1 Tax=Haloplasma contractile SSD-17B TaxID=1033810 RepID=U2FM28_9MOLU|nr:hypothetical protein [Haloplasma contractile]ERJ13785.1 hypothetical protein HLPCO_000451 [Haloplasma contractile SSD-17B]
MRRRRYVIAFISKQSGFMLYELLVSLMLLSLLFYSTSVIVYNLRNESYIEESKHIMVFEHIKNTIERDLILAEYVNVSSGSLEYNLNGINCRYYQMNEFLFYKKGTKVYTVASLLYRIQFVRVDGFISVTFTTLDGFVYEALILYEA